MTTKKPLLDRTANYNITAWHPDTPTGVLRLYRHRVVGLTLIESLSNEKHTFMTVYGEFSQEHTIDMSIADCLNETCGLYEDIIDAIYPDEDY